MRKGNINIRDPGKYYMYGTRNGFDVYTSRACGSLFIILPIQIITNVPYSLK